VREARPVAGAHQRIDIETMTRLSTPRACRISDAEQIRLLRSPVRQDILDSLSASGPATIAELATALGLPADALYYHMRKLLKAGLVRLDGEDEEARGAATYALPAGRMLLDYDAEPEGRAAIADVVSAALRSASRDFEAALESSETVTRGPGRTLRGGRARGWLSPEDIEEVNQLLERVWAAFRGSGPGDDRQLMSFSCVLAPIEARSARREGGRE
jgi:DNA-binding transcriptional ArsR family regulator